MRSLAREFREGSRATTGEAWSLAQCEVWLGTRDDHTFRTFGVTHARNSIRRAVESTYDTPSSPSSSSAYAMDASASPYLLRPDAHKDWAEKLMERMQVNEVPPTVSAPPGAILAVSTPLPGEPQAAQGNVVINTVKSHPLLSALGAFAAYRIGDHNDWGRSGGSLEARGDTGGTSGSIDNSGNSGTIIITVVDGGATGATGGGHAGTAE